MEKASMVQFVWILITAQTKLAGLMRKTYKTESSFRMLAFSVKKTDGFIMSLQGVRVCTVVCRSGKVCDNFYKTFLELNSTL